MTLEELGDRSGISSARISRIEQGRAEVSLQGLLSLCRALEVDITYFTSYQEAATQTERRLREMLARIDISDDKIHAFLGMSFETQAALLDSLERLTLVHGASPVKEQELIERILSDGVAASLGDILSSIPKFGLDTETFCRVITQMEEAPGERLVMSDRLLAVTTPNGGQIEPTDVFRSIFQSEPTRSDVVRRWAQALQSAVSHNVERYESRTIYSFSSIELYIDSGYWGHGIERDPDLVRAHVYALIQVLRTQPHFHVGLIDTDVPFGLLIKGGSQTLVHIRRTATILPEPGPGVAFRSTRPDVTARFRDYFERLWRGIPPKFQDSESVASWLEARTGSLAL